MTIVDSTVAARTAAAAAPIRQVVAAVRDDQWPLPTPCEDFSVADLVAHLLHWGPVLAGAGRKEAVPPGGDPPADRRAALLRQLDATAAAWSEHSAWEGETSMGSPDPMPAPLIGGMVLGEMVVHGWDLAVATGRSVSWDDDVLGFVLGQVAATAGWGRDMGVYADEVPVPATAPVLDRLLGLTGRDPGWTPGRGQRPGTAT